MEGNHSIATTLTLKSRPFLNSAPASTATSNNIPTTASSPGSLLSPHSGSDTPASALLRVQLEHEKREKERLKSELAKAEEERLLMRNQIDALRETSGRIRDEVSSEWRAQMAEQHCLIETLRGELQVERDQRAALEEKITEYRKLEKRATATNDKLLEAENTIHRHEVQVAELRRVRSLAERDADDQRRVAIQAAAKVAQLEEELNAQKEEMERLNELLAGARIETEAQRKETLSMEERYRQADALANERAVMIADLEHDLERMKEAASNAEETFKRKTLDLDTAKQNADAMIEELRLGRDAIDAELRQAQRDHRRAQHDLEMALVQRSSEAETLEKQLNNYAKKLNSALQETKELEERLLLERRAREHAEGRLSKEAILIEDNALALKRAQDELSSAKQQQQSLLDECQDMKQTNADLEEQVRVLAQKLSENQRLLGVSQRTVREMELADARSRELSQQLADAQAKASQIDALTEHLEVVTEERDDAFKALNDLGKKLTESELKVEALKDDEARSASRIRTLEAQLQREACALAEARERYNEESLLRQSAEISRINGQKEEYQRRLAQRDAELTEMIDSNMALRRDISLREERIRDLEERIAKSVPLSEMMRKIQELEAELAEERSKHRPHRYLTAPIDENPVAATPNLTNVMTDGIPINSTSLSSSDKTPVSLSNTPIPTPSSRLSKHQIIMSPEVVTSITQKEKSVDNSQQLPQGAPIEQTNTHTNASRSHDNIEHDNREHVNAYDDDSPVKIAEGLLSEAMALTETSPRPTSNGSSTQKRIQRPPRFTGGERVRSAAAEQQSVTTVRIVGLRMPSTREGPGVMPNSAPSSKKAARQQGSLAKKNSNVGNLSPLARASIHFDPSTLTDEQLMIELENAKKRLKQAQDQVRPRF